MKDFICMLDKELVITKAKSEEQILRILEDEYNYKYIRIVSKEEILKFQVINNKLVKIDNDTFKIHKLRKITYEIYKDGEEKILKVSYNFKTKKRYFQAYKYLRFDKEGLSRAKAFKWLNERATQEIFSYIKCTEDAYVVSSDFSIPKKVVVRTSNIGFSEVIDEIFKKKI